MYQVTSVIINMNCGLTLTYVLSSRELYVLTLKGKSCAWLDQPGLGPVHRVLKRGDRLHWEKVDLPLIWRQVCYPGGQDVHPVERNCDSFNLWPQISLILFSNQEVGSISPRCEFEWLMTDSFNQEFGRDEALQLPRLHYTCYTAFGSLLRHSSFFGALNYISNCWVYEPHGTVTCRYLCQQPQLNTQQIANIHCKSCEPHQIFIPVEPSDECHPIQHLTSTTWETQWKLPR